MACGPSDEQTQELTAAEAKVAPSIAKLEAIAAMLPGNASATEVPCTKAVPADGLAEISESTLQYLLDKNEDEDRFDRQRLSHGAFTKLNSPSTNTRLRKEADTLNGTIINYQRAAEELEKVSHVAVFVPTEQDKGELSEKSSKGVYDVIRPGIWDGWVYVATFEDKPELLTAFPMKQVSANDMTFMKQKGKKPSKTLLIGSATDRVRKASFDRIAKCPQG